MERIVQTGTALVYARKYDFNRVLEAAMAVLDLVAAGHDSSSVLKLDTGDTGPTWYGGGRALFRAFWMEAAFTHDVRDRWVSCGVGQVMFKAYLLGHEWCVQQPGGGLMAGRGGTIAELDPTPTLAVYGRETKPGRYCLLPIPALDATVRLIGTCRPELGLAEERVRGPAVVGQPAMGVSYLSFPHDRYGLGEDWRRVWCVTPDGIAAAPTVATN